MSLAEILKMPAGVDKAKELAIEGLFIDGEHHKQWLLEEILKALGVDCLELHREASLQGCDFEHGIAP